MGRVRGRGASRLRRVVAVFAVVSLLATQVHAATQTGSPDEGAFWEDVGLGVGAVFTNIVYMPAKFVWATLGAVVGGLAYGLTLGSTETANAIWGPTLGGNYVLTPRMLKGEEKFSFSGNVDEPVEDDPSLREYDGQWTQ